MVRTRAAVVVVLLLVVSLAGVVGATNVVSLDDDDVPAFAELAEGTDPLAADTDGDGLTDGAELSEYDTDPSIADTDGDGLEDGPEVNEYGTDPTTADTDGDGLDDAAELDEHGTNPTNADTDGDGLSDGAEVKRTRILPDADPLRMDIYLEVDYMKDYSLPSAERELIVEKFESAPVSNPGGTTGINLHIIDGNQVSYEEVLSSEEYGEIRSKNFDHAGNGYHYVIIIDHTTLPAQPGNGRDEYDGSGGPGDITVTGTASATRSGLVFVHELGHSLGLNPSDYRGIDTTEVSFSDYPSVMSYNTPGDFYGYSDGTNSPDDFDDWGHIESHLYTPSTANLSVSSTSDRSR